eukprot:COSAG02_NODE_4003_length_5927_cov_5.624914_2_plen_79_part_00
MAGEPEKTQTVEGEATWSLRVGRPPLDINIFRKEKVRPGTHPPTRTHARTTGGAQAETALFSLVSWLGRVASLYLPAQ